MDAQHRRGQWEAVRTGGRAGSGVRARSRSRSGNGNAAAPTASSVPAVPAVPTSAADQLQLFDQFAILGTVGGYLDTAEFLKFISNAEPGVQPKGLFEGRGPLAILAARVSRRARAEPDAVRAADDSDQPGHHRRAGAQAARRGRGFLLGAVYGAAMALVYGVLGLIVILTAGTFGTINASPWFNLGIAAAVRRARRSRCST